MPRQPRPKTKTSKTVQAETDSYRAWKADAVKALAKLHALAVVATRDGCWTKPYVRGLSPDDAAAQAAREYDSTHRPGWGKKRG